MIYVIKLKYIKYQQTLYSKITSKCIAINQNDNVLVTFFRFIDKKLILIKCKKNLQFKNLKKNNNWYLKHLTLI